MEIDHQNFHIFWLFWNELSLQYISFHHVWWSFCSEWMGFELIIEDSWLFKFHQVYWNDLRKIFFHLEFRVDISLLLDLVSDEYIVRKWIKSYELGIYQKIFTYLWNSTQHTLWSTHHSMNLLTRMIFNDEVVFWSPIWINIMILL